MLVDQELNYVVEHYSKKGEVKSFDNYFADGEKKRAERLAPKPAEQKKPQKAAEKPAMPTRRPSRRSRKTRSLPKRPLPKLRRGVRPSRTRSTRRSRLLPVRPPQPWIPAAQKRPIRSRCARM